MRAFASAGFTTRISPRGLFVLHARSLPDNPYAGHTLRDVVDRIEALTGCPIEEAHVDKDIEATTRKSPSRLHFGPEARRVRRHQARAAAPLRHRAHNPHLKAEDHLGRCHVKGRAGDAANVLLSAMGHNFLRILTWLRELLCLFLV
jgi:transposase, IS5 family